MTTKTQISVLTNVQEDIDQHKALYTRFQAELSESPISGSRETEIVAEYLSLIEDIESLYMEIVRACADWLTDQP